MDSLERSIISDMSRALDDCDDAKYARLYAQLQRIRATNRWKGKK